MSFYNYEEYDFGDGKVKAKQPLDFEVEFYEENSPNINKNNTQPNGKTRLNRYKRKKITRKKLRRLQKIGEWIVSDRKGYHKRLYFSGKKKLAKKITNRKLRQYKGYVGDGGEYKKFHDYWWNIL